MKTVLRLTFVSIIGVLLSSCGTNKTAAEAMAENDFRNNVYDEIVNDQTKFMEFLEVVHATPTADMWLLKDHMQMMQSGKIKGIVKGNPEMKEKMENMMQEKMENNPEMQQRMQKKMKKMMMNDPEMKKAMMMNMHEKMKSNPEMAEKMMDQMIQFLHENPELMEKMKAKMKAHQDKM
ncbi:MAG: hypothetical protein WB492_07630 [Christiangramia sp.]